MKHIADAEDGFVIVNINADFCKVDGCVLPFDIGQHLSNERTAYSPNVFARGHKVLKVGSVIKGVKGNAGKGVISGVSQGQGDSEMMEGAPYFFVNGKLCCHHGHRARMNIKG